MSSLPSLPNRPSFFFFFLFNIEGYKEGYPPQKRQSNRRRNENEDTSPGVFAATCKLRSLVSRETQFATSVEIGTTFRSGPRSLRVRVSNFLARLP